MTDQTRAERIADQRYLRRKEKEERFCLTEEQARELEIRLRREGKIQ